MSRRKTSAAASADNVTPFPTPAPVPVVTSPPEEDPGAPLEEPPVAEVPAAEPPDPDPEPPTEPEPEPAVPSVPVNPKPVSRVAQILDIKDEKRLMSEMKKFEDSIYENAHALRVLLAKDIHSVDVVSVPRHMTEVERWREKVLRWSALMKTFVSHCKSDHFVIKREQGMKVTEFDREAYQKKLLAPFIGLDYWLEGLVESIDSRVNMCKVLLRLDEAGQWHPGAQKTA